MMADSNSLNSFTLLGFAGKDAQSYITKKKSRRFTVVDIATQEKYRDVIEPKIRFFQVQIWGTKMAPWAAEAVKKGMMVLAQGRMDYHFITDEEGHKQKVIDFKVETFNILRGKRETIVEKEPAKQVVEDPY